MSVLIMMLVIVHIVITLMLHVQVLKIHSMNWLIKW